MNNPIRVKSFLAVAMLATPALSQAITEQEAIDACAQELTAQLEAKQGSPLTYKIGDDSSSSKRRLKEPRHFDLTVVDSRGDQMALRADCVVSASGRVRILTMSPLYAVNND
jgi:hypothetical protein